MKTAAIIILVAGIIMTVITGVDIATRRKAEQSKPVEISHDESDTLYWSPWMGIFLVAVGGSLLIYTRKKAVI